MVHQDRKADTPTIIDGAKCAWPRPQLEPAEVRRWHVVHGHVDDDDDSPMHKMLKRLGFEVYYPKLRIMKAVPRKQLSAKQRRAMVPVKRAALIPIFPGYQFVRFDPRDGRWHEIFGIVGIHGLICIGDMPAPVPRALVEAIKAKEVDGAVPGAVPIKELPFAVGETVRVSAGPFAGFDGVVEHLPKATFEDLDESQRVGLLVSVFGRATPMELSLGDIERL